MTIREFFLPELETARAGLFDAMAARGVPLELADFGGYRTPADTAQLMAFRDADYSSYVASQRAAGRNPVPMATWRPIAPYESSYHSYGAAFDVDAEQLTDAELGTAGALAPSFGLRWGKSFGDPDHFELAVSLADARQRFDAFAGSDDPSSDAPELAGLAGAGGPSTGAILLLVGLGVGAIAIARGAGGLKSWR